MAEVEAPKRKSVSFSDGAVVVDHNGDVTETQTNTAEDNPTADSHASAVDKDVSEVTEMLKGLSKKKKKSTKEKEDAPAADGDEFDPSALKKKKKKVKKVDVDDFEAKLAKAGVGEDGEDEQKEGEAAEDEGPQEGDMEEGTGIWQHSSTAPIGYPMLLERFFAILQNRNPGLLEPGAKSYKIPPPQCLREGNKKTIFANIADICKRMKRSDEHVTQFLFAELGTSGSVDGSRRLVIKGRFQQKQIENVLRRYIVEYVTCKTCRSPDTELSKGENRLYFVTCNSCGSRRSVTAINRGFTALIGKRKKMQQG